MEFSTLVQFSKLVSDSPTSEGIFALLGTTVVEECGAAHSLIFGTTESGSFTLLSSYGACDENDLGRLNLEGISSIAELRTALMKTCERRSYEYRAFPLISDAGLFGVLFVMYSESQPITPARWHLIEGMTELTAISLNKTHQHQKLQKAFDDLRISQDALVRTEKFRALGQMSAGIAHDLKNLLNPMQLYTDHLRDAAGNREEVLETLERVDRILSRGLETVERLRDFSRQSPEDSEAVPTDLNTMVREAIDISKPKLGTVKLDLQLGLPPLTVIPPADCVTAIVNLLFNAIDALGTNGALDAKGTITVLTGASDGGAWVEVRDNGPGIPPEIKTRILEPFFTTKGDLGTGLGIPIVYSFTQRHGGHLVIESEPGRGASFRMWFPAGR